MPNKKEVVLVTGAAGCIGKAICKKFSNEGYAIAAFDIREKDLNSLPQELNIDTNDFFGLRVDVTDRKEVASGVDIVVKKFGQISTIINHVGGPHSASFASGSVSDWHDSLDLNLNSAYYIISKIIPMMVEQGRGNIINIGSVNGLFIFGHPGYSAAKAALIHLTKFIAVEYGKYGIRSNIICPATVKTRGWRERVEKNPKIFEELKELYPNKDIAVPDDVANIATFIASDKARMINGSTIVMDGGLTSGIDFIASKFLQEEF